MNKDKKVQECDATMMPCSYLIGDTGLLKTLH